jgi:diadenosine tetraphosphate (Ap4A) HIT family hydrolase
VQSITADSYAGRSMRNSGGWTEEWYRHRVGLGCPMCAQGRPDTSPSGNRRFYAGRWSDAYLVVRAAQRGAAVVIWRGRHVADPTELEDTEAAGYWLETLKVARTLAEYYSAVKLNLELLGNGVPHLHTHVTCRLRDDVAPCAPLEWSARDAQLPSAEVERDARALHLLLGGGVDGRP